MKTKFNGILTLLLALVVQFSFAQEKTISGTVSDESGGLPGVSVLIKGTKTGTETDFDGKYSIKASNGQVLVFSFLGMKTTEKTVGSSNVINVTMTEDANVLDEVVVTALGVKKQKKSLSYQAQKVDNESLVKVAPTRAASALAGKVGGLQINVQSNGVNPSTQIILRGLRSISQSNSPLIVLDGTIVSQAAFDALNPNNIQGLNIIKGATASAVYGSEAANGVILVTTKSGTSEEKFTIGVNSSLTFEQVAYMPEFQTEYGTGWQGAYDAVENTNWGPRFDGQIRQVGPTFADGTFQALAYAPVKNNLRDFYNVGTTAQNTVTLSAGDEGGSYFMSIGDQKTKGIIPSDSFKRNTFRVNAKKKVGSVELSLNSSLTKDHESVVGTNIGNQNRNLYWFVLNTPANIPLSKYRDWRNDLYSSPDGYFNGYYENPYWAIDNNRFNRHRTRVIASLAAKWDIKDWLSFTSRMGINTVSTTSKDWRSEQIYDTTLQPAANNVTSYVTDRESQFTRYNFDFLLSGNNDLNENLKLTYTAGSTISATNSRSSFIQAQNLSIPGFYDVSNGTGQPNIGVNESNRKNVGFFTDLTLGFKDYLFLTAAGRYDFTSTLRDDDNGYFYPSVGVSFVPTDAFPDIFENTPVNSLKLTVNNTISYNDLPAYRINETYSQSGSFPFGSLNGFSLTGSAIDQNIKKEKLNTLEFGLNAGLFDNRLTLDFSAFKTNTTDVITNTTPSVASGSSSYLTNIGELESKGFDITLGGTIIRKEDFRWDASVNYSTNKQTVVSIAPGLNEITLTSTGEVGIFAVVGEEFPMIKATSYTRDPQGRVVIDPLSGNPIQGGLKSFGTTTPDYILGLNTSVTYKNFTFATTLDYRTGHVYYEQGSDVMEFTGRSIESVSANRQDFVFPNSVVQTSPGVYTPNTNITITGGNQSFWTNTYNEIKENYVKDATAFKVREVSLSYDFPKSILGDSGFKSAKLAFIARNLFTVLPEENRFSDPEFNNSNSNAIGFGGYFQSPPTQSFGFSVNVEF